MSPDVNETNRFGPELDRVNGDLLVDLAAIAAISCSGMRVVGKDEDDSIFTEYTQLL